MAPATLSVIRSWSSKMSSTLPSYWLGPDLGFPLGFEQAARDAHAISGPPDAAVEKVADAEFRPDHLRADGLPLVDECGAPGADEEPLQAAECRQDVLDDPVRQIIGFLVVAQFRNGRTAMDGLSGSLRSGNARRYAYSAWPLEPAPLDM